MSYSEGDRRPLSETEKSPIPSSGVNRSCTSRSDQARRDGRIDLLRAACREC